MFGSIVALVTPYFEDGNIDLATLRELVEWQVDSGTSGIVVCGSTGEGWALSFSEKEAVLGATIDAAANRVPVIMNCGEASTAATVRTIRMAKDLRAEGALVVVPYYVKPNFSGCKAHFAAAADEGLPVMLYHHPGRTGVKLSLEELIDLGQYVSSYKESSGDMCLLRGLIQNGQKAVYAGDDSYALQALSWGAKGVVSVIANAFPLEWREALQSGGNRGLSDLVDVLAEDVNPQGIKTVMGALGRCRADVRLPLIASEESVKQKLVELLDQQAISS